MTKRSCRRAGLEFSFFDSGPMSINFATNKHKCWCKCCVQIYMLDSSCARAKEKTASYLPQCRYRSQHITQDCFFERFMFQSINQSYLASNKRQRARGRNVARQFLLFSLITECLFSLKRDIRNGKL